MAGKNYGVFRRRPDYLRQIRRVKSVTIGIAPILRLTSAIYRNRAVFRRKWDYLRHIRRIKPITITAPPPSAVGGNLYYYVDLMGGN